jgi:glycosyltransferase involved in cell wall biosynthesis
MPVDQIIVCDDLSTDTTFSILKEYKKKHPLLFTIIKNEESLGTIKNFEKAISLTSGDLIFLSDQDDVWHVNKVETMLSFYEQNKACKLLFSDGDLIDETGTYLNSTLWEKWGFDASTQKKWENNNYVFFELLENRNRITGATVCLHKSLKECLPIFGFTFFYHDAYLGINAAAQNGLFFISTPLIKYRIHNNQQVGVSNNLTASSFNTQNSFTISKDDFRKKMLNRYKSKYFLYYLKNIQ